MNKENELIHHLASKLISEREPICRDGLWYARLPKAERSRLHKFYFVQDERFMHVEIYETINKGKYARISLFPKSDHISTLVIGDETMSSAMRRDGAEMHPVVNNSTIEIDDVVINYPDDLNNLSGVDEILATDNLYFAVRPSTFVLSSVVVYKIQENCAQAQIYEDKIKRSGEIFVIASAPMESGELFPDIPRVIITNSSRYVAWHQDFGFRALGNTL